MGAESGYRPVRPGTPLTANQINNNIVRGPQRGLKFSGNLDKRNRRDGVSVDLPDGGGQSPWSNIVRMAQIVEVFEDYLEVTLWNPVAVSTKGASFYVAKPPLLQGNTWDGLTITYVDGEEITYTKDATDPEWKRNHDDGSTDADFVITPNYFVGEVIVILRCPNNVIVDGRALQWMELALGRYWART